MTSSIAAVKQFLASQSKQIGVRGDEFLSALKEAKQDAMRLQADETKTAVERTYALVVLKRRLDSSLGLILESALARLRDIDEVVRSEAGL